MTETWALKIKTPMGTLPVTLTLTGTGGTASASGETVPVEDLVSDGDRLTWQQSVTKPMRLNLAFDVQVDGDTMTGFAKAGRLPRSGVTGVRRSS